MTVDEEIADWLGKILYGNGKEGEWWRAKGGNIKTKGPCHDDCVCVSYYVLRAVVLGLGALWERVIYYASIHDDDEDATMPRTRTVQEVVVR